jgi:hypothetical protein
MEGTVMGLIDQLQGNGNEAPTKVYALVFVITFIVFVGNIILLWVHFLPQMEDAAKETDRLLGESMEDKSIIQEDAIPKIRFVYTLYLICFGILDSILVLMFWRSKVPKSQESVIKALANSYVFVRIFNISIVTMLSIMALVGSNYGFILNLLYLSIVLFSMVSLYYIIYLKRKILIEKLEDDPIFKIPEDATV